MENKSIMKATYIFTGLFLLLVGFFAYYLTFKSESQMNNSYNKLQDVFANIVTRGEIHSSDGKVLATTKLDEDGEEYRYYPYDNMFCHAVGSIGIGKYGIESLYNFNLLTSDVSTITKITNDLQGKKYSGNNVISTLNFELQQTAYNSLAPYKGAVVVMEVDTGKVLTMVSNPSYNPNKVEDNWANISSDESAPILNRVTQGLYTPGSIFKLFTLNEYLNEGLSTDDYLYKCSGVTTVDGQTIGCSNRSAHGNMNLKDSFAYSCNCSFVNIGTLINVDKLNKTCTNLLFNSDLPLSIPYSRSSLTLKSTDSDFIKAQTVFGQGETMVSPMHMAMIVSAIANKGVLMEPMFVESIENTYGKTIKEIDSKEYGRLFTEEESEVLTEYMRGVVEYGTALRLNQFDSLTVYGKTGTAEINDGANINSWFIGFAKSGDKSYAIAVVCENVEKNISPALVIARDVLKVLD